MVEWTTYLFFRPVKLTSPKTHRETGFRNDAALAISPDEPMRPIGIVDTILARKGLDLIPVLFEVVRWSAKHDPLSVAHQQPQFLRQFKANLGKFNKKLRELVRSGGCLFFK